MSSIVRNTIRFMLFILVQVFVLDRIHLHQMVTPYLYFLFILWLPFNMKRIPMMLLAFLLGSAIDAFRHQPGFHAAACVFIAYMRPLLVNLLIPQEGKETNYDEPSATSMGGFMAYVVYIGFFSLLHNAWLFLLEAWQFGNFWYFFIKTVLSTAISIVLIVVTDLVVARKQKFRTNTI